MSGGFSTSTRRHVGGRYTIHCQTSNERYQVTLRDSDKVIREFKTWEAASNFVDSEHARELKAIAAKGRRHVYPSAEIPHLWYHRAQDSARNAKGSMFF